MGTLNGIVVALAALGALAFAWRRRRDFSGWKVEEWLGGVALLLATFAALLLFLKTPFRLVESDPDAARLAATFGLAAGQPLYAPEGPVVEAEAPVAAFAYAPCLLFGTAGKALVAGGVTAGLFILLALAWTHRRGGSYRQPFALLAVVLPYLACFCLPGAAGLLSTISADAPSAGFGLLACACLIRTGEEGPPRARGLLLSALFATLSIWSTLWAAPIALALSVYLWLAWGFRWFARFWLWFAVTAAALTGLFMLLYGPRDLWFTLVTLRWRKPDLGGQALSFLAQGWPLLAALVALAGLRWRQAELEESRLRREAWGAPALIAVVLVPFLVGQALFYLAAAVSLLLASTAGAGGEEPARRAARGVGVALAGVALFFVAARTLDLWRADPKGEDPAYEFARRNPGSIYFPRNPLPTVMAERKVYHAEPALESRTRAGYPPGKGHLEAYVPPDPRYIVVRPGEAFPRERFTVFRESVYIEAPALPGWKTYARR